MKRLITALFILQSLLFAQLSQLQAISIDGMAHTNIEKSSLFQSNDSLFYFSKLPTSTPLQVLLSTDWGETWSEFQQISFTGIPITSVKSNDVFQKSDGSYIIAKLFFGGKLELYNYNVYTNTLTQLGTTLSVTAREVELTYISDSSFIVSLKDNDGNVFYYSTTDGAANWSAQQSFPNITTYSKAINIAALNDNLFAAVVSEDSLSINLLMSDDDGETWNYSTDIYSNTNLMANASAHSNQTDLYIIFEEELLITSINDYQTDVCYISSSDGSTWSEKVKYTTYIGNDIISEITFSDGNFMTLILSNRKATDELDTYLGYLTTTSDPAPPFIYWSNISQTVPLDTDFSVQIQLLDESGIASVSAQFNDQLYTLYDDGSHSDQAAGDNIYGNIIEGYPSDKSFDPATTTTIAVNKIALPINNKGILADVNNHESTAIIVGYSDTDNNSNEVNGEISFANLAGSLGRYNGKGFLFSGGFMLSGYAGSQLWANAVASASLIEDYLPGNVGTSADDPDNLIYSVREGDTPFGEAWQNWSKAVEQGAYFYDGDNDGVYDPVDKNSNGVWDSNEDKPDLLYDGTFFTVFNDAQNAGSRRWNTVSPKGIEIRQTLFASYRNTILDDVMFVRYSLLYKGLGDPTEPDTLDDVIFSIWNDADIGGTSSAASDDRVGCDTLLQAGYTYNDGVDDDWGVNPPAIFKTLVQGPLVKSDNPSDVGYNKMGPDLGESEFPGYRNSKMGSFSHFVGGSPVLLDPSNANEARNYMMGKIGFSGEYPDPCNWGFSEVYGIDCFYINREYWYSGDPVTEYGWVETSPQDQRDITSSEKFSLVKNEPMDIIVAYVVGQGTDALNSITRAREITQYVHEEYERNFSTIVGVNDEKEEVVNTFSLSQNYPNPFNPTSKIRYQIANMNKVELKVYDILGREVTTLVNEVKQPGSYEITFDASQLASGVYFYRLTSGSFVQTKKMILLR